jgi:hypothetical protein
MGIYGHLLRRRGVILCDAVVGWDAAMRLEGLYTVLSGERSPGFNTILKVTKERGSSWMFKLHAWWRLNGLSCRRADSQETNAAFHNGPQAFDGVGRNRTAHILSIGMTHQAMTVRGVKLLIASMAVRGEQADHEKPFHEQSDSKSVNPCVQSRERTALPFR